MPNVSRFGKTFGKTVESATVFHYLTQTSGWFPPRRNLQQPRFPQLRDPFLPPEPNTVRQGTGRKAQKTVSEKFSLEDYENANFNFLDPDPADTRTPSSTSAQKPVGGSREGAKAKGEAFDPDKKKPSRNAKDLDISSEQYPTGPNVNNPNSEGNNSNNLNPGSGGGNNNPGDSGSGSEKKQSR